MIQVIADTNALILPFRFKLNIDSELDSLIGDHEIIIPEPIIGELKRLAKQKQNAKVALKLAETKKAFSTEAVGDDSVLELAERVGGIVFSNDKELIEKAKKKNLRIIRLKEGSRLGFDNDWHE